MTTSWPVDRSSMCVTLPEVIRFHLFQIKAKTHWSSMNSIFWEWKQNKPSRILMTCSFLPQTCKFQVWLHNYGILLHHNCIISNSANLHFQKHCLLDIRCFCRLCRLGVQMPLDSFRGRHFRQVLKGGDPRASPGERSDLRCSAWECCTSSWRKLCGQGNQSLALLLIQLPSDLNSFNGDTVRLKQTFENN